MDRMEKILVFTQCRAMSSGLFWFLLERVTQNKLLRYLSMIVQANWKRIPDTKRQQFEALGSLKFVQNPPEDEALYNP